ncbi:MAG: bifunctional diaminohydroxyphosphoribosylaminopyrimidine deaminase/5-amino-6-(5-phosphoribosylamino)uracil reductase RibD [Clostridium sp.]|nr:bifunctional diaminohydroxyphosphoribosylaminopyrimidine deaminase/5-amino-6-(5-phosphoribosylamino)uracil reductase RibD [Clostridium sp.]
MTQKNNEKYIKKCIKLARKGEGKVSPNPLVGAVILDKNGKIAGYGWHQKYGEAHAEVNAVKMAKEKGIDIKGGTIFVSLEPCSHFGKTPPCCDLIIKEGLKKAVIGCIDPNPIVTTRGIQKLKEAGIEVVTGVLENECKKLNEIFIKNQLDNKPFIAIKTASTLDGKIATKNGSSKWITTEKARKHVQKLRNKYDAILTGSSTVIADNPSLTARIKNGINPIRVIIDSNARTSADSKVFNNDGTKVILAVFAQADTSKYPENVEIIKCPKQDTTGKIDLQFLTRKLYEKGVRSILVEAGGTLNGAFIKEKLADKLYQFIAPKILGDKDGKNFVEGFDISDINDCVKLKITNVKMFNPDIFVEADFIY